MFQNLPLLAAQGIRDSSGVTPCIVMKNDGVLYHQVLSFSPERWRKEVLAGTCSNRERLPSVLEVQRGVLLI